MRRIVARKSDNRLVSFGFEDTSRFDPVEFDIVETDLAELPDEIRFCKYEDGQVVIDEVYKQQVLNAEAQTKQKRVEAREYIENNNPSNVTSVPAMRERIKRLELLLGIYKWL